MTLGNTLIPPPTSLWETRWASSVTCLRGGVISSSVCRVEYELSQNGFIKHACVHRCACVLSYMQPPTLPLQKKRNHVLQLLDRMKLLSDERGRTWLYLLFTSYICCWCQDYVTSDYLQGRKVVISLHLEASCAISPLRSDLPSFLPPPARPAASHTPTHLSKVHTST